MFLKRTFDIAFSSVGLIATAPVALSACFAMAVTNRFSSFPIYKQTRVGLDKEPFTIYKVKSMSDAVDKDGKPLPDEERTSALGKIIRKARIDEFPQFLNILKGDMSAVGPRAVPHHSPLADDDKRHSVKPGLTGPAQIAGKNSLSAQKILSLDHSYVDNQSLILDIKLCAGTPISVIKNRNVPHFREDAQTQYSENPLEP